MSPNIHENSIDRHPFEMIRIATFHIINGRWKIICLVTIVTFLFISISIIDPSGEFLQLRFRALIVFGVSG
jgi:Fe2+ transport system protein B